MSILDKILNGHKYVMRDMSGTLVVAMFYSQKECTSSFVDAGPIYGPAIPFGAKP